MITRDNYQELFLLYTDNELSAAERHEVEHFVADHPDLREEWEALLQCRLTPDTRLAFPDRESLLRSGQENAADTGALLYYIDGLPFLHPDNSIVFPDKDRLYRTARDRRIIPLPWLRAGIAAAVVGALALVFLLTARQKPEHPVQPGTVQSVVKSTMQSIVQSTVQTPPDKKIAPAVTPAPGPALHLVEAQLKPKQRQPVRKPIQRQPDQQQDLAVNSNADEGAAPSRSTIDPRKAMDQSASTAPVVNMPVTQSLAANVHFAVQTGIPKDQSSFATQALQEEQAADQRIVPGDQRTALRGIFRKVKRTFAKTADRDNDGNRQVLVGAFEVSLD
jgi:hypothetical protein